MTGAVAAPAPEGQAPSLFRRMASFAYEGLILFGILLIPGAIGALIVALTGQQHSTLGDVVLQITSFAIYAAYFTLFWAVRGQTLPMQTWHIRVEAANGQRLSRGHAFARYLASWLWIAPAALVVAVNRWSFHEQPRVVIACIGASIVGYALLSLALPHKQFLHDVICGTRLVTAPPTPGPT